MSYRLQAHLFFPVQQIKIGPRPYAITLLFRGWGAVAPHIKKLSRIKKKFSVIRHKRITCFENYFLMSRRAGFYQSSLKTLEPGTVATDGTKSPCPVAQFMSNGAGAGLRPSYT